jgi:hypothetical protein
MNNKNENPQVRVHRIAERFWLGVVLVTTAITIYWWATDGIYEHRFAPVVPLLALLWYVVRRSLRKRLERNAEQ